MKRIFFTALIFSGLTINAYTQQDAVLLNYSSLERNLEKSNERIEHEKRGSKAKTWFQRGELMQDIFSLDLENVYDGMAPNMLQIYYGDPLTKETTQDGKTVFVYDRMKYYFEEGKLTTWERTKSLTENPLDKALEAYKKTLELDDKDKYGEDVKEQLTVLKDQYRRKGINLYYLEEKDKALENLMMVNKINEMDMFEGVIDTTILHYSGIIAREVGNYGKAAEAYEKLADLNFGGPSTYLTLKTDYLALEDTSMAINLMKRAFEKYPDTLNVVANLVDLYIRTDAIEEGLETIDEAINNNPDKGEFYYWKGRLLLNRSEGEEGNIEKTLDVYKKAIEKNPDLYYVYYDMGFIYFLQGQELFTQAGQEKDTEMRKQLNELATEKYNEAIPKLEKAYELNNDNPDIKKETLDVLKRIYYKLQMDDKYQDVTKKLEDLQQGR